MADFTKECIVCGDSLTDNEGIFACPDHFMCNDCVMTAFELAVRDHGLGSMPAKCCRPIPLERAKDLVSPKTQEVYEAKLAEHDSPHCARTYCVDCHCFVPKPDPAANQQESVAVCVCGVRTCRECKLGWSPDHNCDDGRATTEKPEWVPEYSLECRIKACPECKTWIELREACNHMTCSNCRHEFCFICVQPWPDFHEEKGCPQYGDPLEGYDDEGYELTPRGLHRDTGLDRSGAPLHFEYVLMVVMTDGEIMSLEDYFEVLMNETDGHDFTPPYGNIEDEFERLMAGPYGRQFMPT
jgi:hypothetical protein